MIRSFASVLTEQLFFANWSMRTTRHEYGQLEECFLDLRLLDAAKTNSDLKLLFGKRLAPRGKLSDETYGRIASEPTTPFSYEITFAWSGADADEVSVDLSGNER